MSGYEKSSSGIGGAALVAAWLASVLAVGAAAWLAGRACAGSGKRYSYQQGIIFDSKTGKQYYSDTEKIVEIDVVSGRRIEHNTTRRIKKIDFSKMSDEELLKPDRP